MTSVGTADNTAELFSISSELVSPHFQGLRQFSSGSKRTRKPPAAKMDLSFKGDQVSTRRQEAGDGKEEEKDVFLRRKTQKPITRRKESPFPNLRIKDWMKDGIDVSRIPMEHRDIHPNSVYSKMAGSARTLVSSNTVRVQDIVVT